jgi:predicted site-specific integrase-resolvase
MDNYVNGKTASNRLGISINTLRSYADKGKIDVIKTKGGIRRYNIEKYIKDNVNNPIEIETTYRVCYCRVSSYSRKDDLDRQVAYMQEKYPDFEIVTDVGSGINFDRKGLQKIIDYAIEGKLEKLAIAYKDILCRIGYNLVEYILTKYSNTEIIIDNDKSETVNEEMSIDLMQIVTAYTAKINGMRSYKKAIL